MSESSWRVTLSQMSDELLQEFLESNTFDGCEMNCCEIYLSITN